MSRERLIHRATCVASVLFVLLFLSWSLLRYRRLSPDSMNYICAARNVLAGRGLIQCSIGYAGNHLRVDLPATDPLGTHPPLFPLLIALAGRLGAPLEDAALAIPVLAYGLSAAFGALLARRMFGPKAFALTLCLLFLSYPLWFSASVAWAEAPSMALFLGGLVLLFPPSQDRGRSAAARVFAAGLLCGLGFAARYSLVTALPTGLAALFRRDTFRDNLRRMLPFAAGFLLVFGPLVFRNRVELGYWTGVSRNPSVIGPVENARAGMVSLFGQYLLRPTSSLGNPVPIGEWAQFLFLAGTLALLARAGREGAVARCLSGPAGALLLVGTIGYAVVLIVQRSIQTFDIIGPRLMMPATVLLLVGWGGVLSVGWPARVNRLTVGFAALLIVIQAAPMARALVVGDRYPATAARIRRSELLVFVRDQLTDRDLLIADDGQKYPYFLNRGSVYLTSFPQMNHVTSDDFDRLRARSCSGYARAFLVLNRYEWRDEARWRTEYGPLIADLVAGRLEAHPEFVETARLTDGYVFEIKCELAPQARAQGSSPKGSGQKTTD